MNRKKVEDILLEIGIPASIKGFKYITDAMMILDKEESFKYTALYHEIGKMNDSTASQVERAIRHAFSVARNCKGDYEMVKHYIGFINCENSSSLKLLYKRIKEDKNINDGDVNINKDMIRRIIREEIKKMLGGTE